MREPLRLRGRIERVATRCEHEGANSGVGDRVEAPEGVGDGATGAQAAPADDTSDVDPARSAEEAAGTLRELVRGFAALDPQLLVAHGLLALAAVVTSVVRPALRRALASWTRADAMAALVGVVIWIVAISARPPRGPPFVRGAKRERVNLRTGSASRGSSSAAGCWWPGASERQGAQPVSAKIFSSTVPTGEPRRRR